MKSRIMSAVTKERNAAIDGVLNKVKKGLRKCYGPSKCGKNGFCVGFEGNSIYCYGSTSGCLWGKVPDCKVDSDCVKYLGSKEKYTDAKGDCFNPPSGWPADACEC